MKGKFRKKGYKAPAFVSDSSKTLAQARDLIQSRDIAGALLLLNSLTVSATPEIKQQIRALLADAEVKRGRFQNAVSIYKSAEAQNADKRRDWVRPFFGELTARLALADVEGAIQAARTAADKAEASEKAFRDQLKQFRSSVGSGQSIVITKRPMRASVVITRIGHLFLQQGETDFAQEMFERVIEVNSNGGCRARLGIAEIALRAGNHDAAVSWARDAIVRGKFQAKTLSGLPILIAANCKKGLPGMDATLMAGVSQMPTGVRSRAIRLVVANLRKFGDGSWKQYALANTQVSGNSVLAAEMNKILLASVKRDAAHTPAELAAKASSLLQVPNLAFHEWKSGVKQLVVAAYKQGKKPDIESLISDGITRFGSEATPDIAHGLAIACGLAGDIDGSQNLLLRGLASAPANSDIWGKSLWSLGKLKKQVDDKTAAATYFRIYADSPNMPDKLRVFALLEWIRCVLDAGSPAALSTAVPQLESVLLKSQDYSLILDIARQLTRTALPDSLKLRFFSKGERLAQAIITTGLKPEEVRRALFQLMRRYNDFGRLKETTQLWEQLSESKKSWLWSVHSEFWETIGYVIRAYQRQGLPLRGEQLAAQYANDSATPTEGWATITIIVGLGRIRNNDVTGGISMLKDVVAEQPKQETAAYAYYWLALLAFRDGDYSKVKITVAGIFKSIGEASELSWEKRLIAYGHMLLEAVKTGEFKEPSLQVERNPEKRKFLLADIKSDYSLL